MKIKVWNIDCKTIGFVTISEERYDIIMIEDKLYKYNLSYNVYIELLFIKYKLEKDE